MKKIFLMLISCLVFAVVSGCATTSGGVSGSAATADNQASQSAAKMISPITNY